MVREVIHTGNIIHMSRTELEDHCAYLKLSFSDEDSNQDLIDAIMSELGRQGAREEIPDERGADDWANHSE